MAARWGSGCWQGEGNSVERLLGLWCARGWGSSSGWLFGDCFEVTFLAAAHEAFGVALELVPLVSNLCGFIRSDGVVEGCLGDAVEELGKLFEDFAGGGEDFKALLARAVGISHEVAPCLLAEILHNAEVAGEIDDFEEAVEWVATTTACFGLFLRPFVNEGEGNSQIGRDGFGAGSLEGRFENFVRFHSAVFLLNQYQDSTSESKSGMFPLCSGARQ